MDLYKILHLPHKRDLTLEEWKEQERRTTKKTILLTANLTPEPLYLTYYLPSKDHLCLICGNEKATSTLRSIQAGKGVIPLCNACGSAWCAHGYPILRRTKPQQLLWRLLLWKLHNPLAKPGVIRIVQDFIGMMRWGRKAAKLIRLAKGR